jgi:tetratricopeptide (TPR) repeat protein
MIAAMTFESGDREAAIEMQRALIEGAEVNERTRDLQMMLARMLEETGDAEGARAQVATILETDPTHVEALKRRAAWAIEEDRVPDAMRDLRTALDQAPRDPELLTLMATGHEREGSLELAGERLSLAVEASQNAVPESIRYARFLLSRDRTEPARQVLQAALRGAPQDLDVISLLGEMAVRQEDWAEAEALRATLQGRTDDRATQIRETLTAALMLSQDRVDETAEMLQRQIDEAGLEDTRLRSSAMLALLRASEGDVEGARAVLDEVLAENPQALPFRMLHVLLDVGIGDTVAAEERLRAIIADFPGAEAPVRELFVLLRNLGRSAEAAELIEVQLAVAPSSRYLRLVHGGLLSEQGRIDEAVAVYEVLYAEDTSDLVVANNYASLLGTHFGDDPEVLDRAATIARRLRGRDVPAFQDTYGWIEFQRGNLEEALAHLEPSAAAQSGEAIVQYHLGRAYEAAERPGDARAQYERALELAEGSPIAGLPQFAIARERLAALPAPAPAPENDTGGAAATGSE